MKRNLLVLLLCVISGSSFSQNNYLDFDGVNDHIVVSNSGNILANSSTITLSCKVYPTNENPSFPAFDGFAGYRNETNFDFYIIQLTSTEVEARFRNSNGNAFSLSYDGLVLHEWNHFFLVYDGSYLTLFAGSDEVASVEASGSAPANNSSNFMIGNIKYSFNNFYHKGYIDEVSLWNRALNGDEIIQIMNNDGEIADPIFESDLLLYYKFNQGNAGENNAGETTLIDEMGNLDGTLNNFALTGNSSNWAGDGNMAVNDFGKTEHYTYPNPVSDLIHFSGFTEIKTIRIIDPSGRTVLYQENRDSQNPSVNVSQLNQGVYFALVNENQNTKFIKK